MKLYLLLLPIAEQLLQEVKVLHASLSLTSPHFQGTHYSGSPSGIVLRLQ